MPPEDLPDLPALLARYERPLVRYACSILGELESARDVVQETFIRLVRLQQDDSAAPFEGEKHLEAWLFTVCRHRAVDHQRKHSRIIPMPTLLEDHADERPSPSARLEQTDSASIALRLLDQLSPNQAEVIRLKFQNDLSYKEIAAITELTVTNVGFLMHTGLKKLRALMQELPGSSPDTAASMAQSA
jgi:RNA polymerase sigma-70 factor (ECF subfamily)